MLNWYIVWSCFNQINKSINVCDKSILLMAYESNLINTYQEIDPVFKVFFRLKIN